MECSNHTRCQCSGVDTSSPSAPDMFDTLGIETHKESTYETSARSSADTCRVRAIFRSDQCKILYIPTY